MTPDEFEAAQENLEDAYRQRRIGKLMFVKRMSALGFSIKTCQDFFKETDEVRSKKIGIK